MAFRTMLPCWNTCKHKVIIKCFWNILQSATLRLSYKKDIPRTSNQIENLNSQIKQRLKTMRGLKSEDSLNKILKILFYLRKYK